MLTLEEAKQFMETARVRTIHLYHESAVNSDGSPLRIKITSVKVWKTRPDKIKIGYKHGLHVYGTITENELFMWTTDEEEVWTDSYRKKVEKWEAKAKKDREEFEKLQNSRQSEIRFSTDHVSGKDIL